MEEQFKVQYETVGASSYMTVSCSPDAPLVHFQMEMMLSNEIQNFLPVTRQIVDGQTVLYYNITSRIPLKDMLAKRKLTRKELRNLLEGAILAIRDSREFRLSQEGIRMEPEWIFVIPGSCEPAFVFIPAMPERQYGLKELMMDLIYKDQIEMTNDNLIQVLLRELNTQPFSIDRLESSLKAYYGTPAVQSKGHLDLNPAQPSMDIYQRMSYLQQSVSSESRPAEEQKAIPKEETPADSVVPEKENQKQKAQKKAPKPSKPQKPPKKKKQEKKECQTEEEFDREKAKKKFLLPQAVILVALSASISFGLFLNEYGELQFDVIGAAVVIIVVTEIILYREAYVNSRKKDAKNKSGQERGAQPKPSGGSKRPPVPGGASQRGSQQAPPQPPRPIQQTPSQRPIQQTPPQRPIQQAPPQTPPPVPVYQPPRQEFQQYAQPDAGQAAGWNPYPARQLQAYGRDETNDVTELWSGAEEERQEAYLEYFENGMLTRIPLDPKKGLVVGRLRSEVDFAVRSPRVGKIHARFFCRDGKYYVTDINSKNGTYINGSGQRIESNTPWPLKDKDRIKLADCEFTIRCAEG